MSVEGGYRPGAYPMGDDAHVFGLLFLQFAEDYRATKNTLGCSQAFHALFAWANDHAELDQDFQRFYEQFEGRGVNGSPPLTPVEMMQIAGQLKLCYRKAGTYHYKEPPTTQPWSLADELTTDPQ